METVFKLSGLLVMPFWALMIFLPRWRWTERLMRSPLVVAGPALLYVVLIAPRLAGIVPALLRPELHEIAGLLGSEAGATIAWAHFLAFDLFVGRWVYLDARRRGMSPWLTGPVLLLTLLVGPIGFLLHLCLREVAGSRTAAAAPDSTVP